MVFIQLDDIPSAGGNCEAEQTIRQATFLSHFTRVPSLAIEAVVIGPLGILSFRGDGQHTRIVVHVDRYIFLPHAREIRTQLEALGRLVHVKTDTIFATVGWGEWTSLWRVTLVPAPRHHHITFHGIEHFINSASFETHDDKMMAGAEGKSGLIFPLAISLNFPYY